MATPPSSTSHALPPAVVAAEQRAREFLAQAKWRKARDELKPLVKSDGPRYLPLLIQANIGLAREMMAKGQVSEAQQVLSYLATLAPSDQLRTLELELAGKSDNSEAFVAKFMAALAEPEASVPPAEKLRLADQVVLAFHPGPTDDPVHARLAGEVRAVQEALLAASMQQWERLPEILRPVPHRSPFSHWAAFVKGLAAFHQGDRERAVRFFTNLPPETVPDKASRAYLLVLDERAPSKLQPPLAEAVLDGACRLVGQPGVGNVLLRADKLWKEGRHAESYRAWRDSVAQFPTEGLDWLSSISDFYFSILPTLALTDRNRYLHFFDDLISRRAAKNGVEEMRTLRMFALNEGRFISAWGLRTDWEGYLRLHERLHRPNPRFASLAYGWLGEQLAAVAPSPSPFYFGARAELREAQGAQECLGKAIQLDPNNLPAHLKLCEVYGTLRKRADRNRLLDDMVARFPDEKPVLLEAAIRCVERKAYVKGLDYLERARHLDRLDPRIPDLIVTARRRLARQYFQQKRPDKGRPTLALIDEFLTDKPDDLQRSRWTALVRRGLIEKLWGDAASAEVLLGQAQSLSPCPEGFALFAHLTFQTYAPKNQPSPFWPQVRAARSAAPRVGHAALLLRMIHYWRGAPERLLLHVEESFLCDYLQSAARHPFTREEARHVIELVFGDFRFEEAVQVLIKKVLRADPLDPLFRLYKLEFSEGRAARSKDKLESIIQEAVRRGDDATAQKARRLLRELESPAPMPPLPPIPEFDDVEDEDEFDEPPFGPGGPIPDMAPEDMGSLAEVLTQLANASEADLRRLRKSRPKDMPEFVFDMLVEAAKTGTLPPLPGPLPPPHVPPPKPPPGPVDPNQMNLF